ncbi:Proprotein convertase subtilisin/kexin type 5 [Liparis tanakae]|uniref:Proprotein convertase subtilisin/kexin type 5 n=1 Tax=Liparis tanakae TaxID=230148 RepID=A0A4Z2IGZ8_9TELE|nr:Proprotein convertase subtilisin/kexin type 5 [Liparis tanakae]
MIYGTAGRPSPRRGERGARSAEMLPDSDLTEEYSGPCDPECGADGCEGPGPQRCVTCSHFVLKFKNSTRSARSHGVKSGAFYTMQCLVMLQNI